MDAKMNVSLRNTVAVAALMFALAVSAPITRAQEDLASVDPSITLLPPQTVAPEVVLKMMQDKDSTVALVDVQPADGYADGHIPGATSYPWVMQIRQFPISLPRNKTLIIYGSCPNDTSDMVKQLAEFGYMNVKVMDGGWYKWVALKYPAAGKGDYAASQAPTEQSSNVQPPAAPSKTEKPAAR